MSTAHKFTAQLQLAASVPEADNKTSERWSVRSLPEHRAEITFFAADAPTALMRLHFVVQRLMRARKNPGQKGAAARYLPDNYTVIEMRSANGSYDLPGGSNVDFSTVQARRDYIAKERERITPMDYKLEPYPLPFVTVDD
jgi:hypothetical protein